MRNKAEEQLAQLRGRRVVGDRRAVHRRLHLGEHLAQPAAALAAVGEKPYSGRPIYMGGSAHAFERGWRSIYKVLAGEALAGRSLGHPATREYTYGA